MNRARVWRKGLFNDHVIVNLFLIVQSAVSIFRQKTEVSLIDRKKTRKSSINMVTFWFLYAIDSALFIDLYRATNNNLMLLFFCKKEKWSIFLLEEPYLIRWRTGKGKICDILWNSWTLFSDKNIKKIVFLFIKILCFISFS